MTRNSQQIAKAMTAIAAVLAFSTTPVLAQNTAPPDPVTDTAADTSATADPLAPEPAPTQEAAPPAPQPKVETTRTERPTRSAASSTRSTVRRTSVTAPAASAVTPATEAAAPAAAPVEPAPPVAAAPAAPAPVAEPAPTATQDSLLTEESIPILGAAALGLLAISGAGIVAHRRKRRREDEEFAARQQMLEQIDDEPTLELGAADEVKPAPAFVRAAPMHDPVPERKPAIIPAAGSWESRTDADFLFRRADPNVKPPVDAE